MEGKINILGFAGSLRQGSYNRALLRAAADMAPANVSMTIFDLEGIPPFNQDMEGAPPQKVLDFKAAIKSADAILISSPEHNYSIPGVLKNAIDWASRPPGDSAWNDKPVAIMGASTGMLGTARAQYHLRQVFVVLNVHTLNRPEVIVTFAAQKFDEKGNLTDQATADKVRELLMALIDLAQRAKR